MRTLGIDYGEVRVGIAITDDIHFLDLFPQKMLMN